MILQSQLAQACIGGDLTEALIAITSGASLLLPVAILENQVRAMTGDCTLIHVQYVTPLYLAAYFGTSTFVISLLNTLSTDMKRELVANKDLLRSVFILSINHPFPAVFTWLLDALDIDLRVHEVCVPMLAFSANDIIYRSVVIC